MNTLTTNRVPPGSEFLSRLLGSRVTLVAAHPDDETIGAGALLHELHRPTLIHVTDGAPRDMRDALAAGFSSRTEYAAARTQELHDALTAGSIAAEEVIPLNFVDQEASFRMVEMTSTLVDQFRRIRPDIIITHPYEGGHPDHDATAFSVHAACALLKMREEPAPQIVEMTSYHGTFGEMTVARFLRSINGSEAEYSLSAEQHERKRRMFSYFTTQQRVLAAFPIESEHFRAAPTYNFNEPPHERQLYYEQFDWGMTGARWRKLARAAVEKLGLQDTSNFDEYVVCAK